MGFFGSVFKSVFKVENNPSGIDRVDLAIRLIGMKKKLDLVRKGISEPDALAQAKEYIQPLFKNPEKALSTTEGTIAIIIHTYMNSLAPLQGSSSLAKDFDNINKHIITEIENHRKALYPGDDEFPLNIDEYVYYRLGIEILAEFKCAPGKLGFDYTTVKTLSHSAKGFFLK
jgi:hypothetical protein